MPDDQPFRIVLLVGMLVFFPIMLTFRIRSQMSGERLDRRQEGWFILVTLRVVGLIRMAAVIAFLVNPAAMRWSSLPLPTWLRWSGVATGAVAGAWIIWTVSHLGKNLTDTVVTRRDHTLITSGPYRWVRHPFYVGFIGGIVADSLAIANWFVAVSGLMLLALIVTRTDREEAKLVERFGDEYRSYAERTGRFWPKRQSRRGTP